MSRPSTNVDTLLESIYLEMQLEEIDELIENYNMGLITEEEVNFPAKLSALKTALAKAKAIGNGEQVKAILAKISAIKDTIAKGASSAVAKGQAMAGDVVAKGKAIGGQIKGAVANATPQQKLMAGGAVAAVAAIAASVVVYKKFFSQAAKACKGKAGSDKKNCMNSFKAKGLQAAKSKVLAGMSKCKDEKCKSKLQSKAQSFDAKIRGLKGAVAEAVINEYVDNYLLEIVEENSKN